MNLETHTPPEPIAPLIEGIIHFDGLVPDHSIERVVPTGHLFILFELDDIPRHTYEPDSLQPKATYSGVWVSGMHRNHISISTPQNSSMLVVQFKPFGAHPFLHEPVSLLNELIVPAREVVGDELDLLRDRILGTSEVNERFALINQWLLSRFRPQLNPPPDLLEFIALLQQSPATGLKQLITDYPASQKTLIEQFKQYVGLTPKYYQRIIRFNELLQRIRHQKTLSWSDIAHECGFTDQPHFIREFRHFSGFNPSEFISRAFNHDEPNFFALDR